MVTRLIRIVCIALMLVVGLPPAVPATSAQQSTDVSAAGQGGIRDGMAATSMLWRFKEVSPNTSPARPGETVTRFFDGFTSNITVEPTADFITDFGDMLIPSAAPGATHAFDVSVRGRISPGADTNVQGFRVSDAILLVNGRWDGRTAVGVGVNCVTDIFGQPLGCTPPAGTYAENTATFSVTFPTFATSDGLFRFGVGALGCGECFVEYVYEMVTVRDPVCHGRRATVIDADGDGVYRGTPGPDVIVGDDRANTILGGGGPDVICGGGGDDVIRGGRGNDRIYGGGGNDLLRGGKGRDLIEGGRGRDDISGDGGDDQLAGNAGGDTILGGAGDDTANGGAGIDSCVAEQERSCERDPLIPGPLVEWTMRDRYGIASDDGIVRPTRNVDPNRFVVRFKLRRGDGSRCRRSDEVKVTSTDGRFRRPARSGPCVIEGRFPEGTHRVRFRLTTDQGRGVTVETVVVQDWLVIGIGDSNGSGEGTPDRPRGANARWVNRQCHRSANSHQALAARALEANDDQTSVTFRHLACSGAKITKGLFQPYEGIEPGSDIPPQLHRLAEIAGTGREIDAVLVSVGVNDLNFGPLVVFCVKWRNCPDRRWETFGSETLAEAMEGWLERLPYRYLRLANRLEEIGIPPDRVYITEYFDSTKDADGVVCNPLIGALGGVLHFDQAEATWAATEVLAPLNRAVHQAAADYGWNVITGSEAGFVRHGYCAGDQSWIVTREQSSANQGNEEGTLHANRRGNEFQRDLLLPELLADLYPDGEPRKPMG